MENKKETIMIINCVTFTGIDNSVNPEDVLKVSDDYQNSDIDIEWAILLSKNTRKATRYPSRSWIDEFVKQYKENYSFAAGLAGHIQGEWLRDFCAGRSGVETEIPKLWLMLERVQLNFHGVLAVWNEETYDTFFEQLSKSKHYILQMDGVNESLLAEALNRKVKNLMPLFDLSAGRGIVPESWPKPIHASINGYAGGLGPDNIKEELKRIDDVVGDGIVWIDMETKIRSDDDKLFDLDKCRRVLDEVIDYKIKNGK